MQDKISRRIVNKMKFETRAAGKSLLSMSLAAAGLIACGLLSTQTASATPAGSLSIANCGGGGVTVTGTSITWLPTGTVANTGCMISGLGTSVSYVGGGTLGAGVTGNIADLPGGPAVFLTFMGTPLNFILNGFTPPSPSAGTNCAAVTSANTSCIVFAGSPFLLTFSSATTTTVTLDPFGTVNDGMGPGTGSSNWSGEFTTQISMTAAAIQAAINTGGSVSSTYSGTFTATTTPEPGTVTMLLSGLGLLAVGFRRIKR
jgi:hypothetical protein